MANTSRANGFTPVKTRSGAQWTGMIQYVDSAAADRSSDTTNNHGDIYVGDPITIHTDGTVIPADSNALVAGVVVGVGPVTGGPTHGRAGMWKATDLTRRHLPYDEAGRIYYVPVADVLFEVETASDLDLSPGELADFNLVAGTAHGSRTTGLSNVALVVASDNDVQVVENVTRPDNDISLTAARHLVIFKTQGLAPTNAT
jgi:hypothetical protein